MLLGARVDFEACMPARTNPISRKIPTDFNRPANVLDSSSDDRVAVDVRDARSDDQRLMGNLLTCFSCSTPRAKLIGESSEFPAKLPADFVATRSDHRQGWLKNWRRERDSYRLPKRLFFGEFF
jgi:hypothetical protein